MTEWLGLKNRSMDAARGGGTIQDGAKFDVVAGRRQTPSSDDAYQTRIGGCEHLLNDLSASRYETIKKNRSRWNGPKGSEGRVGRITGRTAVVSHQGWSWQ